MLRIVNFAHGALYMLGPSPPTRSGRVRLGSGPRWPSRRLAVGLFGMLLERHDPAAVRPAASYNLLLTFG